MSDVNKQLLDALGKISRMTMSMYTSAGEAMSDAKRIAHEAIAAAEQAQQAEPCTNSDSWNCKYCRKTKSCKAIYDPRNYGGAVKPQLADPVAWVRFCSDGCYEGPLMDSDRRMDEVRRASGAWTPLYAAQPPAVAVPGAKQNIGMLPVKDRYFLCRCEKCGWLGSSEECRESINHMYGDGDYYCPSCGANGPDEMYEAEATFNAMLAAAPQAAVAAPLPPYNVFSDDDGDSWREHPADADFVEGLQLGEEFELLAGWRPVRVTFRVTKVPNDESDDYEVEEVTAPAAAQKGGA